MTSATRVEALDTRIFPWFGPRAGDPSAPDHGFARSAEEPLRLAGPTDRVFLDTHAPCMVDDPVPGRRLVVERRSLSDAPKRAKRLHDVALR